jgi:hypothetical protein
MQGTVTFCRQWCLKSEYGMCVYVETEFHLHFYIWPLINSMEHSSWEPVTQPGKEFAHFHGTES